MIGPWGAKSSVSIHPLTFSWPSWMFPWQTVTSSHVHGNNGIRASSKAPRLVPHETKTFFSPAAQQDLFARKRASVCKPIKHFSTNANTAKRAIGIRTNHNNEKNLFQRKQNRTPEPEESSTAERICFSSSSSWIIHYRIMQARKGMKASLSATDVPINWIRFFASRFAFCSCAFRHPALASHHCFLLKFFFASQQAAKTKTRERKVRWAEKLSGEMEINTRPVPHRLLFRLLVGRRRASIIQHNWSLIHIITEPNVDEYWHRPKRNQFRLRNENLWLSN